MPGPDHGQSSNGKQKYPLDKANFLSASIVKDRILVNLLPAGSARPRRMLRRDCFVASRNDGVDGVDRVDGLEIEIVFRLFLYFSRGGLFLRLIVILFIFVFAGLLAAAFASGFGLRDGEGHGSQGVERNE